MKLIIVTLMTVFSMSALAQTGTCDCSAALSKDLKNVITESEYRNFKDWLYVYYKSDSTTQSALKQSANKGVETSASAVVYGIPVSGKGDYSKTTTKDNQKYSRLEQIYKREGYITNEELNELFTETFSDNQLEAYKACLDLCKVEVMGIKLHTGKDTKDEFYIQVSFNSIPAGGKITLAGNAQTLNMEPINGSVFTDKLVIQDGQSRTQYFKRLDPAKKASFTLNLVEPIKVPTIELAATPGINQQAVPIGTILASVLNYKTFLKANNLDGMDNDDMRKALWIPCDGRTLKVSTYANYSGGTIPDLRGVFLRGINDYDISFPNVVPVNVNQKNPDNNVAGQAQNDAFQGHFHGFSGNIVVANDGANPPSHLTASRPGSEQAKTYNYIKEPTNDGSNGVPRVSSETRPKNVTVYYYIKIN